MVKSLLRSDLAGDLIDQLEENKHYTRDVHHHDGLKEETIELLQDFDDLGKKKGIYVEISFEDITQNDKQETLIISLKDKILTYLRSFSLKEDPLILVCGLGNPYLTSDAIGPRVVRDLWVSHGLDKSLRDAQGLKYVMAFSPNVLAHTGMESSEVIQSLVDHYHVDVLIVVDALAAKNYTSINRVIQMSDVGIYPGSGVGNHRLPITKELLKIPVLCIGIPTVVSIHNVFFDLLSTLESYFAWMKAPENKLKIGHVSAYQGTLSAEEKTYLLGEVGRLEMEEKRQLIDEVLSPLHQHMILCDKQVDLSCELLAKIVSSSLNRAFMKESS